MLCACNDLSCCSHSICLGAADVRARSSRRSSRIVGPCACLPAKKSADDDRRSRRLMAALMMCHYSLRRCVTDRALRRACLVPFAPMCALARTCGPSTMSSLCRAWIAHRRCCGPLSPTRWSLTCVLPWPCVRARVFPRREDRVDSEEGSSEVEELSSALSSFSTNSPFGRCLRAGFLSGLVELFARARCLR